tara:strand:- start:51328 stop:52770 length:1443 start_codon:yes stop_codon:yes gene_type:complete
LDTAAWTFLILLAIITASGAMSVIRKRKTPKDYLVASREVAPWLTALSTVATNNSGFMFIGMIAYTYRLGIESVWMMLGWILGDLTAWFFVHPRVREAAGKYRLNTLSAIVGTNENGRDRAVIILAGLITVIFLAVYAAGQLKAGSTALHALFGWDMWVGALIGTAIVILYSFAGGIRADIWTDAAQSFVMIAAMAMILVAGFNDVGGWGALMANLEAQDPALVAWFPENPAFGIVPYLMGFMFAGFGATGQPHLMTRLMAVESLEAIRPARFYYFLWYIPFFIVSIGVGLYCRAIIPELASLPMAEGLQEPTELALPVITMRLLPDIAVGIALAGLFAATVSTADSQIIVCSGALTHDINPRWKDSYLASKLGTFAVTGFALGVALYAPEGVFGLVLVAWSALGASLGSVLLLRLYRQPIPTWTAIGMMLAAIIAVVSWHLSVYDDQDIFKILPGFAAAFLVYAVWRVLLNPLLGGSRK